METVFFLYSIILLLVFTAAGIIALSAYFVSQKHAYLYILAYFAFYVLDLALMFQYEYLGMAVPTTAEAFYAVTDAPLKIALSLGALECLWLLVCDFLDENRRVLLAAPAVVYVVLECAILVLMPDGRLQQWSFYTARQLFIMWMLAYLAWRRLVRPDDVTTLLVRRYKPVIAAAAIIVALIIVEDSYNILVLQPDFSQPLPLLFLSDRNFSENLMSLVIAALTFRASAETLRIRFQEPPASDKPQLQSHIDDLLPQYAVRYGLTAREREITRLVLLGKDNQNIASELQLALGTVKAHVHNILKKTGQPTRRDLTKDFWKK